jgi:hypothetical protein
MMFGFRALLGYVGISLTILLAMQAPCSADDRAAINEQFHISIYYPDTWAQIPVGAPNEVFRLWSSLGKGTAGCTVAANDTKIRTNTDESLLDVYKLLPQMMEGRLLGGFKNPDVLDRKITTLSNLKAISIVASVTYSTLGNELQMKLWSVITQKSGVIYTNTCIALENNFSASLLVFRKIMSSFLIFP